MKNKTKITYMPDDSQVQPFKTVIACNKCTQQKSVTVYPALGENWFECQNCNYINKISTAEMEVFHD